MIVDLTQLDTTPGACGAHAIFAPPADFSGGAKDYLLWLKDQHAVGVSSVSQYLTMLATDKRGPRYFAPRFVGPFADALEQSIDKLSRRQH